MKNTTKRLGLITLALLLAAGSAFAQDALSGKYEGSVKTPDETVSLELKNESGKVSGRMTRGTTAIDATEGSVKDGTLSLTFGKEGSLTAKVDGDKLVGEWSAGTQKRAVELKKVPAAAAAAPAAPAPAAAPAAFDLNGQWDAVADANGQPIPFALMIKVDGETVTGSSSSQIGDAVIKSGTWKDGKLSMQIEGQAGVITLSAVVVEGKLSGEYDFSGQAQGKWVAVKKN